MLRKCLLLFLLSFSTSSIFWHLKLSKKIQRPAWLLFHSKCLTGCCRKSFLNLEIHKFPNNLSRCCSVLKSQKVTSILNLDHCFYFFSFSLLQEHQISMGWIPSLSSTHPLLFAIPSKFCKLPSIHYLTWFSSVLILLPSRAHVDFSITVLLYYFPHLAIYAQKTIPIFSWLSFRFSSLLCLKSIYSKVLWSAQSKCYKFTCVSFQKTV